MGRGHVDTLPWAERPDCSFCRRVRQGLMSVANGAFGKSDQGAFIQSAEGSARTVGVDLCWQGDSQRFLTSAGFATCEPLLNFGSTTYTRVDAVAAPGWKGGAGTVFTSASSGETATVGTVVCSGTISTFTETVYNCTFGGGAPPGYLPYMIHRETTATGDNSQLFFLKSAPNEPAPWLFVSDDTSSQRVYSSDCETIALDGAVQGPNASRPETCASGAGIVPIRMFWSPPANPSPRPVLRTGWRIYHDATFVPAPYPWFEVGTFICADNEGGFDWEYYTLADASFDTTGAYYRVVASGTNIGLSQVYVPNTGGNDFQYDPTTTATAYPPA